MMTGESRNTAFIQASDATLVGAAKQENSVAFDVLVKCHKAKVELFGVGVEKKSQSSSLPT